MSINLAYDDTVSRVRITAAELAVSTYRVERSTNGLFWRTVRGAVSLTPQSGEIKVDDYEFAADVENFYRVLDLDESPEPVEIEADSITPSLEGQIWLKSIRWTFLNRPVTVTDFGDISRASREGLFDVVGRSVPVATSDVRGSRTFTLEIMTATADDALAMDLMLAAGGVLFVHTPPGCVVPGGHVAVGSTVQQRRTRSGRSPRRYFQLPCTVVAPPGPDVTGGTMTYAALLNLYGGYDNLLAANPSYADLLELMADPEDLVVL